MARSWANAILKLNRSQLKKRKIRELKDLIYEEPGKTKLQLKKLSHIELEIVKNRIRNQAKKDSQREIFIYLIALLTTGFILWVIIKLFS